MRKSFPVEFVYQVFCLLTAFIVVHGAYVLAIRPQAEAFLEHEAAAMKADPSRVEQDSFLVVIKAYEQEACFILMLWTMAILGFKAVTTYREQRLLETDLLGLPESMPIGREDTRALRERIESLPEPEPEMLPARALLTGVERYAATGNIQDVSTATRNVCESEGERLESELSIIRYIAWAIPSVGFIGTVRGIGDALSLAHRAVQGDITGVTASLGTAFNSTFIALVISIVLMFLVHQLQLMQERLVLDSERYVDNCLIRRLRS